jgi:hypothetical protein
MQGIVVPFNSISPYDNLEGPQNYLLEPSPFFKQRYPVAIAACLVEISHNVTNQD